MQLKRSFAIFPTPALQPVHERFKNIDFIEGEGIKAIAADKSDSSLTLELVRRQIRPFYRFDDAEQRMVAGKKTIDKAFIFKIGADGRAETPGSGRDFALLGETLMRCGEPQGDMGRLLQPSILRWARALTSRYEHAQFGGAIVDRLFLDPRNIGRYGFKTVDNAIDWVYLDDHAGQIGMLKIGFFYEGCKRSAQLTSKGTLVVSSQDAEDAEHFLDEQSAEVWRCGV